MIKIISQAGTEVFDFERNNIFVCGERILISDRVNIYESKAALLGIYNDEAEAQDIFRRILKTLTEATNIGNSFYYLQIPPKEERKEEENAENREQGENGENDKV